MEVGVVGWYCEVLRIGDGIVSRPQMMYELRYLAHGKQWIGSRMVVGWGMDRQIRMVWR